MVASEHIGHFGRCRVHPCRRQDLRMEVAEAGEWTIGILWQVTFVLVWLCRVERSSG